MMRHYTMKNTRAILILEVKSSNQGVVESGTPGVIYAWNAQSAINPNTVSSLTFKCKVHPFQSELQPEDSGKARYIIHQGRGPSP
ncbi:hypothetical protein Nepgr_010456 [Nepenthes gracilis]|uniref:Uncharacterized protein n=1 Tax=Nepenthes gracilis TaxID=150966 RepID=A0AAD3SD84_NEPGR|nr:hypothetical protein Nepgr_010456 [Nepenthes gracilis]